MGNRKVKGREYNTLKKVLVLWMAIIAYMVTSHRVTVKLEEGIKKTKTENAVNNIFDEMQINYCEGLRRAKNIRTLRMYNPPVVPSVPFEYKSLENDPIISSSIDEYWPASIPGVETQLTYKFYIYDPEKGYSDGLQFTYRSDTETLYIFEYRNRPTGGLGEYGEKDEGALPLEELERYRDYFLYEVIIGEWMKSGESRYTMEDLGCFTIVDHTLPYEYCGSGCGGVNPESITSEEHDHEGTRPRRESYLTWLDNGRLRCIQQKTEYDYWEEYPNVTGFRGEEIEDTQYYEDKSWIIFTDYYRTDADSSRFVVQDKATGKICRLEDLVSMDGDFIRWLKESGQASGNLERTPESREAGEKDTLEMLGNCPEEKIREALAQAEFFIEPGYLHIRMPYWDYRAQEPDWVRNGNMVWKGWLTLRTEDIKGFLKTEPW